MYLFTFPLVLPIADSLSSPVWHRKASNDATLSGSCCCAGHIFNTDVVYYTYFSLAHQFMWQVELIIIGAKNSDSFLRLRVFKDTSKMSMTFKSMQQKYSK